MEVSVNNTKNDYHITFGDEKVEKTYFVEINDDNSYELKWMLEHYKEYDENVWIRTLRTDCDKDTDYNYGVVTPFSGMCYAVKTDKKLYFLYSSENGVLGFDDEKKFQKNLKETRMVA